MTQPLLIRNRNIQLYSDALNAVWQLWDMITDPSYALSQEVDLWEIIQRDPKVYQGIQQRLSDIAGPKWRVFPFNNSKSPKDKLAAAIMDDLLHRIPAFQDFRRRLASAVFRGRAFEAILGRRELLSLANTDAQMWWAPTGFQNVDPRRVIIRPMHDIKPDGTRRVRGELWISVIPQLQFGRSDLWMGRYAKIEHPEHYVRVTYDNEESRLGHGRGILDVIYFYHWAKQIVLKEGLQGLERWAHGMVYLKLSSEKQGPTSATDAASAALETLAKMRSRHFGVIDKDDEIVVEHSAEDGNLVMGWLNYLDSCLIGVCTGATLKSGNDVGAAGSYASDKVGADIQAGVVQFDINKIDENISTDLIGLLMKLNRPQLAHIGKLNGMPGLEDANRPEFHSIQTKAPDYDAGVTRLAGLMQIPDFEVRQDEAYEMVGCTPPEPGDKTFKGAAPMDPSMIDPATGLPMESGEEEPEIDQTPGPEDDETLFTGAESENAPLFDEARPDMQAPAMADDTAEPPGPDGQYADQEQVQEEEVPTEVSDTVNGGLTNTDDLNRPIVQEDPVVEEPKTGGRSGPEAMPKVRNATVVEEPEK